MARKQFLVKVRLSSSQTWEEVCPINADSYTEAETKGREYLAFKHSTTVSHVDARAVRSDAKST